MEIVETLEEKKKGLEILINHLEKDPNPTKNKFKTNYILSQIKRKLSLFHQNG